MNVDLGRVRSVQWEQSHRWELSFTPAPPSPFNEWFPAVDVNHDHGTISTYGISAPVQDLEIPSRMGAKHLSISFLDSDAVLEKWLESWRSQVVFQNSQTVAPVASCLRRLRYLRRSVWYEGKGETVNAFDALVFPTGNMQVVSSESATLKVINHQFGVMKITPL